MSSEPKSQKQSNKTKSLNKKSLAPAGLFFILPSLSSP
jgi:hypothetical protein